MHTVQESIESEDDGLLEPDIGLREQKRLATRRRIEDAATRLVDESSFDAVTIENICEVAGISRRTFFNYFSAKEGAVIGIKYEKLNEEQRQAFINATDTNIVELLVQQIAQHLDMEHQDKELHERRQRIFAHPDVSVRAMAFRRERAQETMELITQRLTEHPEEQHNPEIEPATEAMMLGAFIREATWMAMSRPDLESELPLIERIYDSMNLIKNYTKGLKW